MFAKNDYKTIRRLNYETFVQPFCMHWGMGFVCNGAFKYSATTLTHLDLTADCSHQPTREDDCGMNGLQANSTNGEEKGAKAHLRLLCLLILGVFSHLVHEKVTERGVLQEVFSHHCDIVLSRCHVLVATVRPCYEVCLGDRKFAGFW